jgi:hypothetical protein
MVGLKLTSSKYSQCFFGKQDKPLTTEVAESNDIASKFLLAQTKSSSTAKADTTKHYLAQTKNRTGNTFSQMSEP